MSDTFRRIGDLVHDGQVRISSHGYDEMAEDGILAGDVIDGIANAVVIEDYPSYPKGPRTLVLLGSSRKPNSRSLGYPARASVTWSPYLSVDDARKLDEVREALRRGDIEAASRRTRVFSLTPVSP